MSFILTCTCTAYGHYLGCSLYLPSQDGVTPLMTASYSGHPSVVRVLLQAEATINSISQVNYCFESLDTLVGWGLYLQ